MMVFAYFYKEIYKNHNNCKAIDLSYTKHQIILVFIKRELQKHTQAIARKQIHNTELFYD